MTSGILAKHTIDLAKAESELDEYKAWIDTNSEFAERPIVSELKRRIDLCLLIQLAAGKGHPDCYKHEFAIQGALRADLVVGSTTAKHFVLVEFESGEKGSIFNQTKGTAQLRDWSNRLERAFSQVSDWSWAKNDNQKSDLYRQAFGMDHMTETYLIVCGRSSFLDQMDQSRLHWRSEKTLMASCPIRFWTYDDLHQNCSDTLSAFRAAVKGVHTLPAAP
jgi:hypothetical protein